MDPSEMRGQNIIEIFDLNEFLSFVKEAPLFIYEPEHYPTPFLDEEKIRSVTCHLIGVQFNRLSTILKYKKSWRPSKVQQNSEYKKPKDLIDTAMRQFISKIKIKFHAIKGNLPSENQMPFWNRFI